MKPIFKLSLISLICLALLAAGCSPAAPNESNQSNQVIQTEEISVGMPNPASVFCQENGGTLVLQTRGDGGQYGVCLFEDNLQCEEWAMFREECPVGGIKVTGYITEAAVYCAITGGTYTVTGADSAGVEQGTCDLPGGSTCDAWAFFNGTCPVDQ